MSFKHTFEYSIFEEQIEITKDFLQKIKKYSLTKDIMNSHNFLKKDKSLLNLVNKKIKKFLDKHKLKLIDSWIQKYGKNDYHSLHTHFATVKDYSFVWFIEGSEDSSPIIFYEVGYPIINTGKKIIFNFKPGTFLLFPGFMPHEVPLNKNNNRLIISGNAI